MFVVEIDERGRMNIPEKLGIKNTQALVISTGSYFITIPLSKTSEREATNWLSTDKDRPELKVEAEKLATEDAVNRAKRRHQL